MPDGWAVDLGRFARVGSRRSLAALRRALSSRSWHEKTSEVERTETMVATALGRLPVAASAVLALAAGPAQAQGPTFDCAKAQGQVEQLICKDQGLAALDRTLDEVYKAALAKARDGVPQLLRTEQRGWVKGRNECWKVPTFLTASWQAKDLRECVEGTYRLRISELQATMRLLPPKGPVFFACENNPANEIVATFFASDPPTARLERGDQTVTVWLVPAGSGSRYEGQNVEFWTKGAEATVTWLDARLQCSERKP